METNIAGSSIATSAATLNNPNAKPSHVKASTQHGANATHKVKAQKASLGKGMNTEEETQSEELNPTLYYQNRCEQIDQLQKQGVATYPHKFHTTMTIPQFIEEYGKLDPGQHFEEIKISLSGRIMRVAESGKQMKFYDVVSDQKKIQVMCSNRYHNVATGVFAEVHKQFKRGDIVGIKGFPGKSKRGELSLFSHEMALLSPCLRMLPGKYGLKEKETRFRQRYLDLIVNPSVHDIFLKRSKVIQYIREFLVKKDFVEVETPMMNMIPGGAAARPFKTFHNDLDTELYMRIAPELYLKTLIVGGFNRVFEIGKNFRNEGIDLTHNPEFTSCEFYYAYADYNDLMNLTEELLAGLVHSIHGSNKVTYHPNGPDQDAIEIDFTPPYPKLSIVEEIEKAANVTLPRPLDSDESVQMMIQLLKKHAVDLPNPPTPAKLLDQLCGHFVEKNILTRPAFLIEHPQIMSPLAKWHRNKPELTERFELFVAGKEICNAYTELNDPKEQRLRFQEQQKAVMAGDTEACPIDEGFCTALDYGLPPTAGWGLGIDRLVMFLTDTNNIKEVILFPALRPTTSTMPQKSTATKRPDSELTPPLLQKDAHE